jgi:hypothetical protein
MGIANKRLHMTATALANFGIIARPKRFGGRVGAFLPHRARARRHNAGVRFLSYHSAYENYPR